MTPPAPRQRTRSNPPPVAPPAPRMRVRSVDEVRPTKQWRAPAVVPEDMPRAEICALGQIDVNTDPAKWQGWPNGSLVLQPGGKVQKGRHIPTPSGKIHVLLWNRMRASYVYMRLAKNHAEAMTAL